MEERLAAYLDLTDSELANLVVALLLEERLGARLRCFREDLRPQPRVETSSVEPRAPSSIA